MNLLSIFKGKKKKDDCCQFEIIELKEDEDCCDSSDSSKEKTKESE